MLQRRTLGRVLLILLLQTPAYGAELVAPYVNTVREDVELMLDLAAVGPEDYLIDLGSGDGRIVIAAAERGARGHGVELQPELVALAEANAREAGVADRARFLEGDIFEADLTRATVVTAYLFPEANLKLRPKLLEELPSGTRVVSNAFDMGDWIPDQRKHGRTSGGAMLWIIPARVDGNWILEMDDRRLDLHIEQRYQRLQLSLLEAGERIALSAAELEGDQITFSTGGSEPTTFMGQIDGRRMTGVAITDQSRGNTTMVWQARLSVPSE